MSYHDDAFAAVLGTRRGTALANAAERARRKAAARPTGHTAEEWAQAMKYTYEQVTEVHFGQFLVRNAVNDGAIGFTPVPRYFTAVQLHADGTVSLTSSTPRITTKTTTRPSAGRMA